MRVEKIKVKFIKSLKKIMFTLLAILGFLATIIGILQFPSVYEYFTDKFNPIQISQSKIINNTNYKEKHTLNVINTKKQSLYNVGLRIDVGINKEVQILVNSKGTSVFLDRGYWITKVVNLESGNVFYIIQIQKIEKELEIDLFVPPKTEIKSQIKDYKDTPMPVLYFDTPEREFASMINIDFNQYFNKAEKILKYGVLKCKFELAPDQLIPIPDSHKIVMMISKPGQTHTDPLP